MNGTISRVRAWVRAHPRRTAAGVATGAAVAVLVVLGAAALVPLTHGGAAGPPGSPAAPATVAVSASSCAAGWTPPAAGRQAYLVRNTGRVPMRVTLVERGTGGVYGQLYLLAAGTTRRLDATVPRGAYVWRCVPIRGTAAVSAVRRVRGRGGSTARPLRPVDSAEITASVDTYRAGVTKGLASLVRDTHRLRTAVDHGPLARARQRWLVAHLDYERLGAAYDTFGDSDAALDGRPDGLPRGTGDPHFTGFLRLEYGLWHGQRRAELRPVAAGLDRDAVALQRAFPKLVTNPGDLPLRAHEILENTLQFVLTDRTDLGSHTSLATARANVAGTRLVLGSLVSPLQVRDPGLLHRSQRDLTALDRTLARYEKGGRWTPLAELSQAQREDLNARTGDALEELALLPGVLQLPPAIVPP